MQGIPIVSKCQDFANGARRSAVLLWRGLALGFRAAPREGALILVCMIVTGVAPTIVALAQRALVDHFSDAIALNAAAWTPSVA